MHFEGIQPSWRIDTNAIMERDGIQAISSARAETCLAWLRKEGYRLNVLDGSEGATAFTGQLNAALEWEERFGYRPDPTKRGYDAMKDAFWDIPFAKETGRVLVLRSPESAWQEEPEWFMFILQCASEASRVEIAMNGNRFFVILLLDEESPLLGRTVVERTTYVQLWDRGLREYDF